MSNQRHRSGTLGETGSLRGGLGERKKGAEGICLATCQNAKQKHPNHEHGLKGRRSQVRLLPQVLGRHEPTKEVHMPAQISSPEIT